MEPGSKPAFYRNHDSVWLIAKLSSGHWVQIIYQVDLSRPGLDNAKIMIGFHPEVPPDESAARAEADRIHRQYGRELYLESEKLFADPIPESAKVGYVHYLDHHTNRAAKRVLSDKRKLKSMDKPTRRYHKLIAALNIPAVPSPCEYCPSACCKRGSFKEGIGLTDAELKSGRYQSKDGLLEYDDDGNCVYLSDGKCSIYDNRPYVCREYDCRTFAAFNVADTGLVENGMPRVTQLFKFESEEDSEYLKTVSAIGRQLHEEGALNGASKSEEKAVLIMNRYSERYGGLFSEKTRDTVMKKLNA